MRVANETGEMLMEEIKACRNHYIKNNKCNPQIIELDKRSYDILNQYFRDDIFNGLIFEEDTYEKLKNQELLKVYDMTIHEVRINEKFVHCK